MPPMPPTPPAPNESLMSAAGSGAVAGSRMRICVLANARSLHTKRWATAYAQRGHDVHVLSIRSDTIPGVQVHTACVGAANSPSVLLAFLSYAWLLVTVRRRLREIAPDVLHAHYATTHGVIAAASGFRPMAISVWGDDVIWQRSRPMPWYRRALLRFAFRRADLAVSSSRFMAEACREWVRPGQPVEVVPWGVDPDQFCPGPTTRARGAETLRIGFVKHLEPTYGPDLLLRAMRRVVDAVPGAKLIMAGRGPLSDELRDLARSLGIEPAVEFVGLVPHAEVPDLMRSLDVLVNCSRRESFGVAILEASACGVPVVVTRVGGAPETCRHGETGLLVEADDPDALADAIITLARDPALRARMGQAGRAFVLSSYLWRDNVSHMLRLLERLVASRPRRSAGASQAHSEGAG